MPFINAAHARVSKRQAQVVGGYAGRCAGGAAQASSVCNPQAWKSQWSAATEVALGWMARPPPGEGLEWFVSLSATT